MFLTQAYAPPRLEAARLDVLHRLEEAHKSRAIALIHRQESVSLLGIPIARYIDIDDSEAILRVIRLTPDDQPIDLVLHKPGGLVLAAEQIAQALAAHKGKVTVFVPHYAMSGGTLLALAADAIVMDPNAVLGPVDPQLGEYPAASLVKLREMENARQDLGQDAGPFRHLGQVARASEDLRFRASRHSHAGVTSRGAGQGIERRPLDARLPDHGLAGAGVWSIGFDRHAEADI